MRTRREGPGGSYAKSSPQKHTWQNSAPMPRSAKPTRSESESDRRLGSAQASASSGAVTAYQRFRPVERSSASPVRFEIVVSYRNHAGTTTRRIGRRPRTRRYSTPTVAREYARGSQIGKPSGTSLHI